MTTKERATVAAAPAPVAAPPAVDTAAPGAPSATQRLYEEARRYMPGGTSRLHYYFPPHPIYARRAQPPESPTIDVVWGDTFLQVVWTGGGDVADTGTPLRWVVYVDGDSVGGLAQAPGVEQVVEVDGTPPSNPTVPFTPCTYHHVYVRIIGQHGFLGATSNTVSGQTCCGTMCDQLRPYGVGGGARAQVVERNYPLALGSPHPNPARDGTEIRWSIPRERAGERFQLALFDVGGRKITTVAEGNAEAGLFARKLRSQGAAPLTSGVYFLRLQIGGKQLMRSLILTR